MKKSNTYSHLIYNNQNNLKKCINILIKNNIKIYDIYSPCPIKNIDKIIKLNIKNTKLGITAFISGIFGCIFSIILTWYTMNYDWKQNIGGKPNNTWINNSPAFIPVIFEFIIFFSVHCMFLYYLISCKLFPGKKNINPEKRTTNDKFLIIIDKINNKKIYQKILKTGILKIK